MIHEHKHPAILGIPHGNHHMLWQCTVLCVSTVQGTGPAKGTMSKVLIGDFQGLYYSNLQKDRNVFQDGIDDMFPYISWWPTFLSF